LCSRIRDTPVARLLKAFFGPEKSLVSHFPQGIHTRRKGRVNLALREPVTEERVRDAIVEIAGIETEDLLYFSHSNKALSHLPYMIALDRRAPPSTVPLWYSTSFPGAQITP